MKVLYKPEVENMAVGFTVMTATVTQKIQPGINDIPAKVWGQIENEPAITDRIESGALQKEIMDSKVKAEVKPPAMP